MENDTESIKALRIYLQLKGVRFGAGTYQEYERAKKLMDSWIFSCYVRGLEVPDQSHATHMVATWIGV